MRTGTMIRSKQQPQAFKKIETRTVPVKATVIALVHQPSNGNMKPESIPKVYPQTYTDTVDGFLLVYNPISEKGLAVLNREAAFLFGAIDGKRTLGDIWRHARKEDPSASYEDIVRVFSNLISSEIVYIDKPKSKRWLFAKRPRHLGVWLHITNQCNLRCTYCYVWKTSETMSENTADRALEKIITDAAKHKFTKITVKFSGGECLLRMPEILRLVSLGKDLAQRQKIVIDFVVLTNGVLITDNIATTLKREGLRAAVSLDGLAPYHDAQRVFANGLGSFNYVVRGIENLQKAGVPFNISVTITGKNINNISQLTSWMLARNIPFAFNFYRENPYVKEDVTGDDTQLVTSLKKRMPSSEPILPVTAS